MRMHLVSFNVPFPANYGGVIDVFYKLRALSEEGVQVVLHCFDYGRGPSTALNTLAAQVHYYPRKTGLLTWLSPFPYIIAGRRSAELTDRLCSDNDPVVLEGIHCAGILAELKKRSRPDRRIFIRCHNVESEYYHTLAQQESDLFKRFYFSTEARRLRNFEPRLAAAALLAISEPDLKWYSSRFPDVRLLHAFHAFSQVQVTPGKGKYALYHGNLAVKENEHAALFLVQKVLPGLNIPLLIAGDRPFPALTEAIRDTSAKWVPYGSDEEGLSLIRNAQVNILPSFSTSGIKLKLIAALYNGRHVLVNSAMVKGTGLEAFCHVHDEAPEMKNCLEDLMNKEITSQEITERSNYLQTHFSNRKGAQDLMRWMSPP